MTGSHDLSIGYHRISNEKLIEKTLLRVEVENKINDMVAIDLHSLIVADISCTISHFTVRY